MRILVFPHYTISNLRGASELLDFKDLMDEMFRAGEKAFFYFYVPMRLQKDLPGMPNTQVLWYESPGTSYYDQEVEVPADFLQLFNERMGQYPIDAVWTNRTQLPIILNRLLWDFRCRKNTVPVFVEEFGSIDRGKGQLTVVDLEIVTRSLGYAYGYPIFDSSMEQKIAVEAARHFVKPSVVEQIVKNAVVIPHNIPTAKIDKIKRKVTRDSKKFKVFFGGRLNSAKRARQLLKIYDMFYAFGRDVDIVVTSPRAESPIGEDYKKLYQVIKFVYNCPFETFIGEVVKSDVVLSLSKDEGLTLGVLQMMYAGPVVLLPALYWVRGLLKEQYESYPFLYKNLDEARMLLRYVHLNLDKCQKKMEKVREWVKKAYGSENNFGKARLDFMRSVITTNETFLTSIAGCEDLLKETLGEMEVAFTLDEFYFQMIERSRAFRQTRTPTRGMPSRYRVYKWLISQGLSDNCKKEVAEFDKGGVS